ncbi:IclR family transcriptional regulator [Desulfosediminicola sp.]|uniref:IclR family transcriptional regulator n=1 Tax=Desulfosediminicola sp. TaxID=2886825 RepID=UPI003AF2612D
MTKAQSYFSKSLEKGLKILSLFNRERPALSQTEIANITGLNMTSTYRYINTLVEMGYLEKDHSTKVIRPTIFCLAFCNNLMKATDHKRLIQTLVDAVHKKYNVTIDVALSVDNDMMRIYHREAADTLTYSLPDFTKNSLHNTALGKAYLSTIPQQELDERLAQLDLTAKTKKTITDRDTLKRQLLLAKVRRYAVTNEEYLPGLIAIGAPLYNPHSGKGIGAVSFDFSILQRSPEDLEMQYAPMVVELAEQISATIPLE